MEDLQQIISILNQQSEINQNQAVYNTQFKDVLEKMAQAMAELAGRVQTLEEAIQGPGNTNQN